ncbi:MAG: MiaB/RimO family radical SAM methylthiotransferase [Calditrichaeota bacterium]|nr:MiaB/RimO family radical SAM methylthiotransferase [Calditrichota bacterium]
MSKQGLFTTIGCKLNQAETAQIVEIMRSDGLINEAVFESSDPQIIFVNTCAVTGKAAAKSRHAISKLAREHPEAVVIAAGCLAQYDPESLTDIPGVDYVLGTAERFSTKWWTGKPESSVIVVGDVGWDFKGVLNPGASNRSRRLLKIQDGCEHGCTYCIIPKLRGKSRSVPHEHVIASAIELIESGVQEIILTGVRIGSWGQDLNSTFDLTTLLVGLTELPGNFRIRLGSIEPWELSRRLVDQVIHNSKICPHLHIPFQHTDTVMLEKMGRPGLEDALELLLEAKKEYPGLSIGTDLIAGFPGETDSSFERLVLMIKEIPLAYLHAFGFSARPGTLASELPDKIPGSVIKERVAILNRIRAEKKTEFQSANIDKILTVIPENLHPGSLWIHAVSENYLRLKLKPDGIQTGQMLQVRVVWDDDWGLTGVLV